MQHFRKWICLLAAFTLLLGTAVPALAAQTDGALTGPDGGITGIANRGVWSAYPENSLPALLATAETGLKYALADVSRTKDGVLVLMAADAAARMLGTRSPYVADHTFEELSALPLRDRAGGAGNRTTQYHICTLAEALPELAAAGITPVLKFDAALAAEAAAVPGAENCVLYFTGKTKDALAAVRAYAGTFSVLAEKRSNVIFSVLSFVKALREAGAAGAVLKTTNRYGVNYYRSTLQKFGGVLRAVADTSTPEVTGARQDCEKWWDDLVSRGYDTVITDDPVGFGIYLTANAAARGRLREAYDAAQRMTLPTLHAMSDYRKAWTDATAQAQTLLDDPSSSTQDMTDAYAALTYAAKNIETHFDEIRNGTAEKTVTLPRILLCAGAAAAVIAVQIYFYKRRKTA